MTPMAHGHADAAGTPRRQSDPVAEGDRLRPAVPTGAPTAALPHTRLDLKALRMAVHGWWLGNPLVYKPGAPDLTAVARELAAAGAASGTIVVSDAPAACAIATPAPVSPLAAPPSSHPDHIAAALILRPPRPLSLPSSQALETAALHAVAETAQAVLGPDASRVRANRRSSQVLLGPVDDQPAAELCSVEVEQHADVAYVGLRLALDQLQVAGIAGHQDEGEQLATGTGFFSRPDWREVFLARVLHALEGRLGGRL